jgi:hypothetical protein
MIDTLDKQLSNLLLREVEFRINNKIYKRGKIKLFNLKQFFIKFIIEKNNVLKTFEVPYPYKIINNGDNYVLDYALSSFCPIESLALKIQTINSKNCSKLYNNYINILIL